MNEIERVSEEVSGVKDGVALDAQCMHIKFLEDKMAQQLLPCRILTSWENGVVSISFCVDEQKQMVSVRLDELLALLGEANAARIDAQKEDNVEQKDS